MHQIRFPLRLRPNPRWGAYSAPQGPLAVFKGPLVRGWMGKQEQKKKRLREKERKGERKGGFVGCPLPTKEFGPGSEG